MLLIPGRTVDVLGVRFIPAGLRRLIDVPQQELTDRRVDANDFLDKKACLVLQQMLAKASETTHTMERFHIVEQLLLNWFKKSACWQENDVIDRCVEAIQTAGGQISMEELAAKAGLSLRQLERQFLNRVGISPKIIGQNRSFPRFN